MASGCASRAEVRAALTASCVLWVQVFGPSAMTAAYQQVNKVASDTLNSANWIRDDPRPGSAGDSSGTGGTDATDGCRSMDPAMRAARSSARVTGERRTAIDGARSTNGIHGERRKRITTDATRAMTATTTTAGPEPGPDVPVELADLRRRSARRRAQVGSIERRNLSLASTGTDAWIVTGRSRRTDSGDGRIHDRRVDRH